MAKNFISQMFMMYIDYRKEIAEPCPFSIRGVIFSPQSLAMLAVDIGDDLTMDIPIAIRNLAKKGRCVPYDIDDPYKQKFVSYRVLLEDNLKTFRIQEYEVLDETKTCKTDILFGFRYTELMELVNEIISVLSKVDLSIHNLENYI